MFIYTKFLMKAKNQEKLSLEIAFFDEKNIMISEKSYQFCWKNLGNNFGQKKRNHLKWNSCFVWNEKKTFFSCLQNFLQWKGFVWQQKEKFQTKFNLSERFLSQRKVWKLSSFQEQIWSVKLWRHVSFFFQKCARFWREANFYHRSANFYYSDLYWGALQTVK